MAPIRIFVSSVQEEFVEQRLALRDYVHGDPLMRRFFEVFLFEDAPAADRRPEALYLNEVERSDIYVGLFGSEYGTEPIPSYQVYQGTVFELVDQAVDFVLSKINRAIGTRSESVQAPRTYEIPEEVVTEAIVNAVAHRDYTSNGSVQVMLFADRLEVWNPGSLPPPLTFEKLRAPHASIPANPLLAESMYLVNYIERMGTGTLDMIRRCVAAGLPEPEFTVTDVFVARVWRSAPPDRVQVAGHQAGSESAGSPEVTPEVTPEVVKLLAVLTGTMSRREIQAKLSLADEKHFRESYQQPAIAQGLLEMTIPDRPRSRLQRYRLTERGKIVLARARGAPGTEPPTNAQ